MRRTLAPLLLILTLLPVGALAQPDPPLYRVTLAIDSLTAVNIQEDRITDQPNTGDEIRLHYSLTDAADESNWTNHSTLALNLKSGDTVPSGNFQWLVLEVPGDVVVRARLQELDSGYESFNGGDDDFEQRLDQRYTIADLEAGRADAVFFTFELSNFGLARAQYRLAYSLWAEPIAAPVEGDPVARGDELLAAGQYGAAVAAYTQALEADPQSVIALQGRGTAYWRQGDYAAALEDLSAAISLAPDAERYLLRGRVYLANGSPAMALRDFSLALELAPGDPTALHQRGLARYYQGDLAGARADLDLALATETPPDRLRDRALIAFLAGDVVAARADLATALNIDPDDAELSLWYGLLWLAANDAPTALGYLDVAARHASPRQMAYVWYWRAVIYDLTGRDADAARAEAVAADENADDSLREVLVFNALLALLDRDVERAEELLALAGRDDPLVGRRPGPAAMIQLLAQLYPQAAALEGYHVPMNPVYIVGT